MHLNQSESLSSQSVATLNGGNLSLTASTKALITNGFKKSPIKNMATSRGVYETQPLVEKSTGNLTAAAS